MSTPDGAFESEMLRLTLDLWHPGCWTLEVTKTTDAGLLGHGVYTGTGGVAKARFTVYANSTADIDALIEATRDSERTFSVMEIEKSWGDTGQDVVAPGNATREIFVEFDPENSIDEAFVSRGFVYDGPTRIKDGRERWSLVTHNDRRQVKALLDEVREEMDADIQVLTITTSDREVVPESPILRQLSDRQREMFLAAREHGYYAWPREVSARELAEMFDITKTTFLEHLRKAESKLLKSIE